MQIFQSELTNLVCTRMETTGGSWYPQVNGNEAVLIACQEDVGTKFKVILTDNGQPWCSGEDALLSVWYAGSAGEGNYTEIDGRSAFTINENTVEVELITQMLSCDGAGMLWLMLSDGNGNRTTLCRLPYIVLQGPDSGSEAVQQYYTAFSEYVTQMEAAADRAEAAASKAENMVPLDGSKALTGNMNVGGYRIQNLEDPSDAQDAVSLRYAQGAFAPAGYGLGGSSTKIITTVAQLDNIVWNGWARFACVGTQINGFWFNYASVFVINIAQTDSVWQELRPAASNTLLRRFRDGSGVWSEWEFENPPMVVNVEYRTTERWRDKPVYTKLVDFGAMPDSGTGYVQFTASGLSGILEAKGMTSHGWTLPYRLNGESAAVSAIPSGNGFAVYITTDSDMSAYTAAVVIKYTKA